MLEITKYELHPSGRYLQERPDMVNLSIDEVGWDGALQVILSILNQENDLIADETDIQNSPH